MGIVSSAVETCSWVKRRVTGQTSVFLIAAIALVSVTYAAPAVTGRLRAQTPLPKTPASQLNRSTIESAALPGQSKLRRDSCTPVDAGGLKFVTSGGGVSARPVAVGDYLYVSTGATVAAWNMATPSSTAPTRTGCDPEPGSISGLAAAHNMLYASTLTYTPAPGIGIRGGGISVYTLADPAKPTVVARLRLPESALGYAAAPHQIAATADALYAVNEYGAVFTYSLANPELPEFEGAVPYWGNFYSYLNQANSVTVRGDHLIVTGFSDGGGARHISVLIYDISDPLAPTVAGFRVLDGPGFGPAFAESNAVVVTEAGYAIMFGFRFAVFDLRDPQNIEMRYGSIDYPRPGVTGASAVVRGNYAYVTTQPLCTFGNCGNGGELGVDIWDITDPEAPVLVRTAPIDLSPTSYQQAADSPWGPVFVGADNGVAVLDVSTPTEPALRPGAAARLPLLTSAGRVDTQSVKAVFGSKGAVAYVIGGSHGFSVVNPRTLAPIGRFNSTTNPILPPENADIAVDGRRAYYIDNTGFSIVDISNPASPTLLGRMDLPVHEGIGKVAVRGSTAYLTTSTTLRIVDISNPSDPVVVGTYRGFYQVAGAAIRGEHLFLAAQTDLLSPYYLFILDVSRPSNPTLVSRSIGCDSPVYSLERLAVSNDGNRVYLSGKGCGRVDIFDTTNRASPALLGSYTPPDEFLNSVGNVVLDGHRFYVDTGVGVDLVDASSPQNPTQIKRYAPLPSSAARVWRSRLGLVMFFSYRQEGVAVYQEARGRQLP